MKTLLRRRLLFAALCAVSLTVAAQSPTPTPAARQLSVNAQGRLTSPVRFDDPNFIAPEARSASAAAYRDPALDATTAIDSRLVGKTASAGYTGGNGETINPGTVNLFSATNYVNGTGFVRNVNLWCADLVPGLACFSPWNSQQAMYQGGTLITRRHVLLANHFSGPAPDPGNATMPTGTQFVFFGADNTRYVRSLTALVRVGSTDMSLGTLDSDLPAAIAPATILPVGPNDLLPIGTPVLFTNKNKEARVAEVTDFPGRYFGPAVAASRASWTLGGPAYAGDSGSPIFVVLGGRALLWQVFHFAGGGGEYVASYATQINALLPNGYTLNIAKLPLLGKAAKRDAVGTGALVGLTGNYIDPQYLPPASGNGGGTTPVEQTWDGQADVTVNSATTVVRLTTPAVNGPRRLILPSTPANGQEITVVTPALSTGAVSICTDAGNGTYAFLLNLFPQAPALPSTYRFYGGAGAWRVDLGTVRFNDAPRFTGVEFAAAANIRMSEGFQTIDDNLSTRWLNAVNDDPIGSGPDGSFVIAMHANETGSGYWRTALLRAGEAPRAKADGSLEGFVPGDFGDLGSLPGTVVNGRLIRVGAHAYMGLGGVWKQLDN